LKLQTLKPGFHLIGAGLKPGGFKLMGKLEIQLVHSPAGGHQDEAIFARSAAAVALEVAAQVEFESKL
jgi:hypothetical protein